MESYQQTFGVISLDFSLILPFSWFAIHPACLDEKDKMDKKGDWVFQLMNLFIVDRDS